jgi:hypothetical protein
MAKVKLNPIVESVRGGVGDLVFRKLNGDTVLSGKPDFTNVVATPDQEAHRARFKQAVAYGRMVLADNDAREDYDEAAQAKGKSAFALMVADFMQAPSIDEIDVSQYSGQTGDFIYIRTSDDFTVEEVDVRILDNGGTELESASADFDSATNRWVYEGQTNLTPSTTIRIEVTVTDRPGGTTTTQHSKNI